MLESNEYMLSSDTNSKDKDAQIEGSSSWCDSPRDENTPLSSEDDDSQREVTPYVFGNPFEPGEEVLETVEEMHYDFMPRQEPRTEDHNIPESRCSPLPCGPVQMIFSRLKTELRDEIYDAIVITCIRKGESIGCLKALIARRSPPSPVFSNHLHQIYEKSGRLLPELLVRLESLGSGVWGSELNAGDCMFIDTIAVLDSWEGLGIGRKMADMALEKAKELGISWVFTFPHSWDHRERRGSEGQLDLAVGYWRSMGFRRVGASLDFCYSVDTSHPSRNIAPDLDFDPPAE